MKVGVDGSTTPQRLATSASVRRFDSAPSSDILYPVVSFDDWESGKVKLDQHEIFDPVFGDWILGYTFDDVAKEMEEHRNLAGFRGRESGTMLGSWFAEVMECRI